MTKSRVEAFSDGVIAIIITIMVLELHPPHSAIWDEMKHLLPVMLSYLLSFVIVAIYWGNHHHLLHSVKKVNSRILWSNMHLLFWLSLIPFATAWMGENNCDSTSVRVYSLLQWLCGMAYYILLLSIKVHHSFSPSMQIALKQQSKKGIISNIFYAIAFFLSFFNAFISAGFIVTVAIIWLIPDRNIERALNSE